MTAPTTDHPGTTTWPVTGFALSETPTDASGPGTEWIPAQVPGGVHEALIAAGRLVHPYRDRQEENAAWVEDRSWWYRATLQRPDVPAGHHVVLDFAGIDTVATVWIDGREVARHCSQFRPLRIRLDDLPEAAEVLVRIDPPLAGIDEPEGPRATRDRLRAYFQSQGALVGDEEPSGVMSGDMSMTLRRKGLFSWGWDFAPRLPSVGLIGPVTLQVVPDTRITGAYLRTLAVSGDGRSARVCLSVEVTDDAQDLQVVWSLRDPQGRVAHAGEFPASEVCQKAEVREARLWWTHDLGEPVLHDVVVELRRGDRVVDCHRERVGLRTIELDQGDDGEGGRRFRFALNGKPLFARGANWVPPSMLVGSVTDERVTHLVTLARDAQMTMLRIWGGGMYERDAFYAACDELGILVWQDFMFACLDYPDTDEELRSEVTAEVEHQVRRLRNRPCLALWCGNNEASAMHLAIWGTEEPGGWGEYFYDELLPSRVGSLSPGALYRRGSPHGTLDPRGPNGVLDGDRHAWEVWHGGNLGAGDPPSSDDPGEGVHFWRYRNDSGRFISEFGIHAAPELSTLRRWTDEPLTLHGPALAHRIKDTPKTKGHALLVTETGAPTSTRSYLTSSMMVQAEGLMYGIAHYRRRQPTCSGTLVWQLDEPWPGLTWSVIDHDGVPKAAWYALRRVYAPVLASVRTAPDGDGVEVWVTNSTRETWTGELTARLSYFAGGAQAEQGMGVTVAAGDSRLVATLPAPEDPRAVYAEVIDDAGQLPRNRLFLDHLKHLPVHGTVEVAAHADAQERASGRARVAVVARGHAYAVRVEPPLPQVRFSDGYFDLPSGQARTIEVTGLPAGFDAARLEVRTWADDQQ